MLKRISKIQGIGAFSNCTTSGKAEFRKKTLVFGYNSRGKSTLAEIFRSLESDNAEGLKSRLTIPDGRVQSAAFSLSQDEGAEVPHLFDGTSWKGALSNKFIWRVFDSGFIARNVLSGDGIERTNKENFSKFILGENGVKKAEEISESKQESRRVTKELNRVNERIKELAGHLTIENFLGLKPEDSRINIKAKHDAEISVLAKIREDKTAIDAIKNRASIEILPSISHLSAYLLKLDELLKITLNDVHDGARNRLSAHVATHMSGEHGQRDWLQKGVDFIQGNDCPFCEQPFSDESLMLVEQYKAAFNDEFSKQLKNLKGELDAINDSLVSHALVDYCAMHNSNIKSTLLYPELAVVQEFKQANGVYNGIYEAISVTIQSIERLLENHIQDGRAAIERKKQSFFEVVELSALENLFSFEELLDDLIVEYNKQALLANDIIGKFKDTINLPRFLEKETATAGEILRYEVLIRRIDNEPLVEQQKKLVKDLKEVTDFLVAAQADLEREQSAYLEKFFIKIDYYFKVFGSSDFAILKAKDGRGDLPVYTLSVKYKGKEISSNKLGLVFSESDKRALALSIFWARLSVLDPAELASIIVVLDDPVTSFDEDRTTLALHQFRLMAEQVRQSIYLSHYGNFVRKFLELEVVGKDFCLLSVDKDAMTSHLALAEPSFFVDSEHQKKLKNILDFIEKKKSDPISYDLRVFLEEEIKSRFRLEIIKTGIANATLNDIINRLHAQNCFAADLRDELHMYREALNPAHHTWDGRSPDDWASYAEQMLAFIYNRL